MRRVEHVRSAALVAVATALTVVAVVAARQAAPIHTVEARVPVTPAVVPIDGRAHLVYELHLTNLRREPVDVERVTVRASSGPATSAAVIDVPLIELSGPALAAAFVPVGVPRDPAAPPSLPPGRRAVIYVWRPLAGTAPTHVTHDIAIAAPSATLPLRTVVSSLPIAVDTRPPVAFGPPLAGGPWVAVYDPLLMGGHRTTLIALDGVARIPARFAVDWIAAPPRTAPASPNAAPAFNGAGSAVLAVADGTVVTRRDGVADQPPGVSRTPQPLPLDDGSGNHVVLDIGGGRFVIYEHLQRGSVRVGEGARVRRGEVIAALGSSGSTSIGPHLHFHVADAGSTLAAEGVPWTFERFGLAGRYPSLDALMRGEAWTAAPEAAPRQRELPPAMAVVRFDAPPR